MSGPELKGFKELERKLNALGVQAGTKVIRQAASAAMNVVVTEARAKAPVGSQAHKTHKDRVVSPGFLSRNIKKFTRVSKSKGTALVFVGPSSEAYYGSQFVEVGTKNMAAQPWLEPAYESKKSQVVDRYGDELRKRIKKVAAKR
jgi:HK97 gp10 family phage protein